MSRAETRHPVGARRIYADPAVVSHYRRFDALFAQEACLMERCYPRGAAGLRVLDVGCGAGRIARRLRGLGAQVWGVDISLAMLAAGRERGLPVPLLLMDARQLAFVDASFDDVWFAFNGLDLLLSQHARRQALREIHRVLKPGGRFVFSSHNAHFWLSLRPSKLANLARNALDGQLFAPGWRELRGASEGRVLVFHQSPRAQLEELRAVGFHRLEIHGKFRQRRLLEWADHWPYYVAHRDS